MAHLAHHNGLDRRSFLQGLTAAGAAATLVPGTSTPARAQGENTKYETLLKGGRVVDPSQNLSAVRDIAFANGKVALIAENISPAESRDVHDVTGKLVVPGLIDDHTHFHWGLTAWQYPPHDFREYGVAAAADCGSNSANFLNLRDYIIRPAPLHLYAFMHTDLPPATPMPAREKVRRQELASTVIAANRDTIVGIKVVLPGEMDSQETAKPMLDYALQVAGETGVPIMVHINGGMSLATLTDRLRPGDIITHCFHSRQPNILGPDGKVRAEIRAARQKGIFMDQSVGNQTHLSWRVAQAALEQGFPPDIISSDFPNPGPGGTLYTLPDCISMMLGLGMSIEKAITAATVAPATGMRKADVLGSLAPGRNGEAAIFDLERGAFPYEDMDNAKRTVNQRLVPMATVMGGRVAWASTQGRDLRRPKGDRA
jgi:dihydroorotase